VLVDVALPVEGPLIGELRSRGARVHVVPFPVLRKSVLRPGSLVTLLIEMVRCIGGVRRLLRRERPGLVLVNTLTIPGWLAAARLAGIPSLCHVHEAEEDQPKAVRLVLAAPLALADGIVANSAAAATVLERSLRYLRGRILVVHNGVPGPPDGPGTLEPRSAGDPLRIALVGRLSPRKGIDVAIRAVGLVVRRGYDVTLSVCGTVFPGYEWFEADLRELAAAPQTQGRVDFAGYLSPTWPVLAAADLVLVPSRVEPFGNTAVEALLAERPLVASRTQGLREVVRDGVTGLLVEPGSEVELADAIARLAQPDALIWIHDYHFFTLGECLRRRGITNPAHRAKARRAVVEEIISSLPTPLPVATALDDEPDLAPYVEMAADDEEGLSPYGEPAVDESAEEADVAGDAFEDIEETELEEADLEELELDEADLEELDEEDDELEESAEEEGEPEKPKAE